MLSGWTAFKCKRHRFSTEQVLSGLVEFVLLMGALMNRRFFAAMCAVLPCAAIAGDITGIIATPMTAPQVDALLSGNTIRGMWNGTPYSQFFNTDGRTVYIPDGGRPDHGKWRVNAATGQYESWWERSNWTGYKIMMTNGGFAWVSRGELQPFEVFEGKQVTW